jgi:hypothetical protein
LYIIEIQRQDKGLKAHLTRLSHIFYFYKVLKIIVNPSNPGRERVNILNLPKKYTWSAKLLKISTSSKSDGWCRNHHWGTGSLVNIQFLLKPRHFKVDDVSALEPSSKPPVRIVEDNVTASLHQQRTP